MVIINSYIVIKNIDNHNSYKNNAQNKQNTYKGKK